VIDSDIKTLKDLKSLRSAPSLDEHQSRALLEELTKYLEAADWFTIGIMAESSKLAIFVLKEMEYHFNWSPMKIVSKPDQDGPVFLKANQKTGDIHVRVEHGLGQGILIGCQHNDNNKGADTLGLFPLDFFKIKQ